MGNCMQVERARKRTRRKNDTTEIDFSDLVEFPVDDDKKREDYCPYKCSICLMGILKKDARCVPCVSHVFHGNCLTRWECYQLQENHKIRCPTCMTEGVSQYIKEDKDL